MENTSGNKTTTLTALSWGMYIFWYQFLTGIFDVFLVFFYQIRLGLDIGLIAAAIWVYTIWDAINDPLIGFLTGRLHKFTPKLGKRFPWIILGAIITTIAFVLTYSPPILDGNENPIGLFMWLCAVLCVYDTGLSFAEINSAGLFPDKFRTDTDRRKVQAWTVPIALLALPLSTLLPEQFLINRDTPDAYRAFAMLSAVILIVTMALAIYGIKEDKETIARYYRAKPEKRENFFQSLKTSFQHRAWVGMLVVGFGYLYMINAIQGTVPYYVNFAIETDNSMAFMILMSTMVGGAMIASPIWSVIYKKIGENKKSYLLAGTCMVVSAIAFAFASTLLTAIFAMSIYGFSMGAFWVLNSIILADVYDERAVIQGSDQRGPAIGVYNFFGKFSRILQISVLYLIQLATSFDPDSAVQSPSAIFGIRLQIGIIPAVIFLLFLVFFWKFYPLDKNRVKEVRAELEELGI